MEINVRNVRLPADSRGGPASPEAALFAIEADVQKLWVRLLNVARYECGMRDPSLSRMLEWCCTAILVDGWRQSVDPEIVERFAKHGVDLFDEVESGGMVCTEYRLFPEERVPQCSGYQIGRLEFHHVRPRSMGGHEGPVIPLCQWHHNRVTESKDRTWRQNAVRWGFTENGTVQPHTSPMGEDR